ncbi:Uncharacterised protein [Acinetobacter baumannii]|nr:Uncharacterised protein [Acinetobacter baumannii]
MHLFPLLQNLLVEFLVLWNLKIIFLLPILKHMGVRHQLELGHQHLNYNITLAKLA